MVSLTIYFQYEKWYYLLISVRDRLLRGEHHQVLEHQECLELRIEAKLNFQTSKSQGANFIFNFFFF